MSYVAIVGRFPDGDLRCVAGGPNLKPVAEKLDEWVAIHPLGNWEEGRIMQVLGTVYGPQED